MPADVITGSPGDGKTLLMMRKVREAIQANDDAEKEGRPAIIVNGKPLARRPLYGGGIRGLKPGLLLPLPDNDPSRWNDLDPDGEPICDCAAVPGKLHAHLVPDGSLIFVDEAWQWFGDMEDASRKPPPKHARDLAIHRHRGLDFVWTTQSLKQLYPFVRTVLGSHTYVSRILGKEWANVYEWGKPQDDPTQKTAQEKAIHSIWHYPAALYDDYKSATAHTIKSKVPKRLWLIPVGVVFVIAAFWFGLHMMRASSDAASADIPEKQSDGGVAAADASPEPEKFVMPKTAEGWEAALRPVVPGLAYTAPIFAGTLKVKSQPRIFCAITGGEYLDLIASKCGCLTEQGTKPSGITEGVCRSLAMNGAYDPFLDPKQGRGEAATFAPDVPAPDAGPQLGGVMQTGPTSPGGGTGAIQGIAP